jgi:hypothetical protein
LRAAKNDAAAQQLNQYQSNKSENNATVEEGPYRLLQGYDGRLDSSLCGRAPAKMRTNHTKNSSFCTFSKRQAQPFAA